MTIEVKQLVIKSSVDAENGSASGAANATVDYEQIKQDILAECKQIIAQALTGQRER